MEGPGSGGIREGDGAPTIRILTWNLWAFDIDRPARRRAIVDVLRDRRPDIACLQEVRVDDRSDIAAELGAALDLSVERSAAATSSWWPDRLDDPSARVTNAVLSRGPVTHRHTVELPDAGVGDRREQRTALVVRVVTPLGPVLVTSTQLTSSPSASRLRCEQVRVLAEAIVAQRDATDLVVVAGDLNAEPDSDEVRSLCGHKTAPAADGLVVLDAWRFADPADPGWTWDRRNPYVAATGEPDSRIDYVLLGPLPTGSLPSVTAVRTVGAPTGSGRWPSDHLAVEVDLAFGTSRP